MVLSGCRGGGANVLCDEAEHCVDLRNTIASPGPCQADRTIAQQLGDDVLHCEYEYDGDQRLASLSLESTDELGDIFFVTATFEYAADGRPLSRSDDSIDSFACGLDTWTFDGPEVTYRSFFDDCTGEVEPVVTQVHAADRLAFLGHPQDCGDIVRAFSPESLLREQDETPPAVSRTFERRGSPEAGEVTLDRIDDDTGELVGSFTFSYDADARLANVHYTPVTVGFESEEPLVYDDDGRLLSFGNRAYHYDAAGNLAATSRTDEPDGPYLVYGYDCW